MVNNLIPVTDELQVNRLDPITTSPLNGLLGNQILPQVAVLDNGNFIVVYQNDARGLGDLDIMSIEFTDEGQANGTPFRVDFDASNQQTPDVTHRVGGGYAAVWADDGPTQTDIQMVVVVTGTPSNPPPFTVADAAVDLETPAIATFADGKYIVVYEREEASSDDVWFAIVNAAGTARTTDNTGLVTTVAIDESAPKVATSGNTAAIVYRSGDASADIKIHVMNSSGGFVDFETVADVAALTAQPEVAALADGRFVVVWVQAAATFDVMGRIYDPNTKAFSGAAFTIVAGPGDDFTPAVAGLPDGGFVATWANQTMDGSDTVVKVHARRFDSSGAPAGDDLVVTEDEGFFAANAANADGRVFMSWISGPSPRTTDLDLGIQGRLYRPATEIVNGTAGKDTITTYGLSETINGLAGKDVIDARGGNDLVSGGGGKDKLTGGLGADGFRFDVKLKGKNVDHVTDFTPGVDSLVLDESIFKKLKVGELKKSAYFAGNKVDEGTDNKDLVIYDKKSGKVYYDADGPGGADPKLFAILDGSPNKVKASDIEIVA